MEKIYTQCLLEREHKKGRQIDVLWIEKKFAVRHKELEVNVNGVWTSGWKVIRVYSDKKKSQLTLQEQVRTDLARELK